MVRGKNISSLLCGLASLRELFPSFGDFKVKMTDLKAFPDVQLQRVTSFPDFEIYIE